MYQEPKVDRDSILTYFRKVGTRASLKNRYANPLFRGRDAELEALHKNVQSAIEGDSDNRTAIAYGSPGAGKSELMLQFLTQLSGLHGSHVIAVHARHTELLNAPLLLETLLDSLPRRETDSPTLFAIRREVDERKKADLFGRGMTRSDHAKEPTSPAALSGEGWFKDRSRKLPESVKEHTFVLCVDEIQNLKNPSQTLCESLHDAAFGLKIVPVYFGLGNATEVLRAAGLSRTLDEVTINIGALSRHDTETILRRFLDALRLTYASGIDRDQVVRETAARCDGWPHHLTSWMRAACELLSDREFNLLQDVRSLADTRCDELRMDYYAARVNAVYYLGINQCRRALATIVQEEGMVDLLDLENAIAPIFDQSRMKFDFERFIEESIHAGVLTQRKDGKVEVPIPSLVSFLRDTSAN